MVHVRALQPHQLLLVYEGFQTDRALPRINIPRPIKAPLIFNNLAENHLILLVELLSPPYQCQIHEVLVI